MRSECVQLQNYKIQVKSMEMEDSDAGRLSVPGTGYKTNTILISSTIKRRRATDEERQESRQARKGAFL